MENLIADLGILKLRIYFLKLDVIVHVYISLKKYVPYRLF